MAQDTNAGARTPAKNSGPIFPFTEHLADFSQIAMTLPHMQAALLKVMVGQQHEVASFAAGRLEEDMKLLDQITKAGSVKDLSAACLNFCQDAATQYAAEAGKLVEASSRGTLDAMRIAQEQNDMPVPARKA